MKSVRSVYKIGHGPSSSHTVGPYNAALRFGQRHPDADHFRVTLYGSLAFTGAGHGTGKAILSGLPGAEIVVNTEDENLPHPNTMLFTAFKNGKEIESVRVFSVGGGSVRFEDEPDDEEREIYPEKNFGEILNACRARRQNASGLDPAAGRRGLPGIFIHRMAGHAGRDSARTSGGGYSSRRTGSGAESKDSL